MLAIATTLAPIRSLPTQSLVNPFQLVRQPFFQEAIDGTIQRTASLSLNGNFVLGIADCRVKSDHSNAVRLCVKSNSRELVRPLVVVGTMHYQVRVVDVSEMRESLMDCTRVEPSRSLELKPKQLKFRHRLAAVPPNASQDYVRVRPFAGCMATASRIGNLPHCGTRWVQKLAS